MSSRTSLLGDEVLVRRAARTVAAQTAGLVFAAMLLLVVLVTVVVVRGQQSATDAMLRSSVTTVDDVGDPPPGSWLVITDAQQVSTSPGLPAGLSAPLAALRRHPASGTRISDVAGDSLEQFRVATRARGGRVVQVVLDLTSQHEQRTRLLKAMGGATVLGLLLAGLLGVLVGRRAVRPMAQALALQRSFVADASHELRTPLTLLSTRAQVLQQAVDGSDLPEQVRQDARGVVGDVRGLSGVVEDLLLAADPRSDDRHELVDLEPLVAAVVATAAAHATAAGVTLRSQAAGPAVVLGSPRALRRALLSLIDNAIDHSPDGGHVVISVSRQGRRVVIAVSDSGPGVPAEHAGSVLRRFHSGGQRSGRAHYGLGLALTHDVANRHGGQLRLAPSPTGATFELVLPAAD
ncbi:MAG: hypothetical protein JWL79_1829 [Frankiales bacterium]|nr:hypothetical protein [Frankiales bacterium]